MRMDGAAAQPIWKTVDTSACGTEKLQRKDLGAAGRSGTHANGCGGRTRWLRVVSAWRRRSKAGLVGGEDLGAVGMKPAREERAEPTVWGKPKAEARATSVFGW
ncbi:hypothetical protein GUJ93_ZPchr0008g12253 [Zizania palustris]|uniref:Uncharacterized protein n=1 Tax=Zizania palustris TaxID=103762 RepID=A0A8J5RKC7_ZIZPA|nr:hypothetical protein GUJ93_ZPchr0008g12253 [Zizania palustris]